MLHCIIDHGNTRTKLVLIQDDNIILRETMPVLKLSELKLFLEKHNISKVALSATGSLSDEIHNYLTHTYIYVELSHETPIPITNHYGTPQTLGKDRLAAVIAAHNIYPSENVLVIDAGTCVTYDFITTTGDYYGGSISPGLAMRFRAMHEFTARLPLVTLAETSDFIGHNTETAMRTGAQFGFFYEIEGFINAYIQRFGKCRTLLTGGNASFIAQHLVHLHLEVQNDLVPIGLNVILNYNINQK